jgi:hypothetical protein
MRVDTYSSGFILIVGSTAAAVLGLMAVRRKVEAQTLVACHEVGGYLLSVTGTLFAVLLGMVVVDAMETFQEAHQTIEQEANALSDIVLLARRMPEPHYREVKRLTSNYADLVVGREWEAMDQRRYAPEAREAALELLDAVFRFEPRTESEKTLHDAQVEGAVQLWNHRRIRTSLATHGIPPLKWFVLVVGGVITVFFTYFFVVDSLKVQAAMTGLVALTIALNMYLVAMFGSPFSGDLRVDPSCYLVVRELSGPRGSAPKPAPGTGPPAPAAVDGRSK